MISYGSKIQQFVRHLDDTSLYWGLKSLKATSAFAVYWRPRVDSFKMVQTVRTSIRLGIYFIFFDKRPDILTEHDVF